MPAPAVEEWRALYDVEPWAEERADYASRRDCGRPVGDPRDEAETRPVRFLKKRAETAEPEGNEGGAGSRLREDARTRPEDERPRPMTSLLTDPVMQYGYAGFAIVLLGMLTWIIRESFRASRDTLTSSSKSSRTATRSLQPTRRRSESTAGSKREIDLIDDMREKLLARPCMMDRRSRPLAPTPEPWPPMGDSVAGKIRIDHPG